MSQSMDRRGFLKAMLYLAGAAVLPSVLVEPVRATIARPTRRIAEYGKAISYSDECNILSQFDPDDPIQIQLRKQTKVKVMRAEALLWAPDIESEIHRNRALSTKLRLATIANTRCLTFAKRCDR